MRLVSRLGDQKESLILTCLTVTGARFTIGSEAIVIAGIAARRIVAIFFIKAASVGIEML